MKQAQPQSQPISMLPVFTDMINGMLDTSIEQLDSLYPVMDKPHILDDDTINRIITLYTDELNNQVLFKAQFIRWKKEKITISEEREINRLIEQQLKLQINGEKILKLARRIEHNTIDKIMAMKANDLMGSIISGKIKPPW